MEEGNPSKTVMYYLLIRGMSCLGHYNGFHMVSTLMCMVTLDGTSNESWHWLLGSHYSPNYYVV